MSFNAQFSVNCHWHKICTLTPEFIINTLNANGVGELSKI